MNDHTRNVVIKRAWCAQSEGAPLGRPRAHLCREGTTRDGAAGHMFDAGARMPTIVNLPPGVEAIVIISGLSFPRQTPSSSRTQGFTRDLMAQAERDLGTKFELNRVDPHVHVITRGKGGRPRPLSLHTSAAECAPAPPGTGRPPGGDARSSMVGRMQKPERLGLAESPSVVLDSVRRPSQMGLAF